MQSPVQPSKRSDRQTRPSEPSCVPSFALPCGSRLNFCVPRSAFRIPRFCRLITHYSALITLLALGCAPRETRFQILDHREGIEPARYFEAFDECYYTLDRLGRMDLVARRVTPPEGDQTGEITQVIHLQGIWRSDPGRTHAERSMINTTVSYMILSGRQGAAFEGGGFVFFTENRAKTEATGALELAKLSPKRRLGEGQDLFDKAELKGEFKAVRDTRRLVRILNEMRRLFGPLPRHQPPLEGSDLL